MAVKTDHDELNDLCKQMYEALCRVSNVPTSWGGGEVMAAIEAAEQYIEKHRNDK